MLELDPVKRISMKNALKDKYFDEIIPQIKVMYDRLDKASNESKCTMGWYVNFNFWGLSRK